MGVSFTQDARFGGATRKLVDLQARRTSEHVDVRRIERRPAVVSDVRSREALRASRPKDECSHEANARPTPLNVRRPDGTHVWQARRA